MCCPACLAARSCCFTFPKFGYAPPFRWAAPPKAYKENGSIPAGANGYDDLEYQMENRNKGGILRATNCMGWRSGHELLWIMVCVWSQARGAAIAPCLSSVTQTHAPPNLSANPLRSKRPRNCRLLHPSPPLFRALPQDWGLNGRHSLLLNPQLCAENATR